MISKLIIVSFILCISIFSNHCLADQQINAVTDIAELGTNIDEDQGIAIIFAAKDQPNVSLFFREIELRNAKSNGSDEKKYKLVGTTYRLDMSESQDLAIFLIPKGSYQVFEIEVPHFDLPYAVDTQWDDRWRFKVKSRHINYLANLDVSDIRSRNSVQVNWLNKIASNIPRLNRIQNESQTQWPLAHGAGYRDKFFDILNEQQQ